MEFNLEEWNKLSKAECERRYKPRIRNEERGKSLAVIVALVLFVCLLIAVSGNSDHEPRQRWPHLGALPRSGLMGAQARVMGALSD
jgi:hypothetical protein